MWRSMTEKHLLGRHKRFFEIHPLLLILLASKLQFSSSSITYINRDQLTTNPEGNSNPSHTLQAPVRSPTYTPQPSTTCPISTNPQNVAPRIHCSAVPHPTPCNAHAKTCIFSETFLCTKLGPSDTVFVPVHEAQKDSKFLWRKIEL